MNRLVRLAAALCVAGLSSAAGAASVLLEDGTVHTGTATGTIEHGSVLIVDGRIRAIGRNLPAPAGTQVVPLGGRVVTAALFGGIGTLGVVEVSGEHSTDDSTLKLGQMRPEFDPALAFNPDSVAIGVARVEGVGFTLLVPGAEAGGKGAAGSTILPGEASVATLDGHVPAGPAGLEVLFGEDSAALGGGSRAAAPMLFAQALEEARGGAPAAGDARLLSPAGRRVLARAVADHRPFLFNVDRAADIRAVLALAEREKLRAVIVGGAEAWRVAPLLARARVPVVIDPFDDLPASFDRIGATLENAARLHAAGVEIAFSLRGGAATDVRKLRQAAGNAVAHGLPWDAAFAAVTRTPAMLFGATGQGTLAVGATANVVVWSGDPLEVTSRVTDLWLDGQPQSLATRQTALRDRYLQKVKDGTAR